MGAFIVLYRGINVGGNNPVKMPMLRAMHERLGHRRVQSYIQSGNIVFWAKGSAKSIAEKTVTEFAGEFGFEAKLIVVDANRWAEMVRDNPYARLAAENHKAVHVGICQGKPSATALKALLTKTGGNEAFV